MLQVQRVSLVMMALREPQGPPEPMEWAADPRVSPGLLEMQDLQALPGLWVLPVMTGLLEAPVQLALRVPPV